MKVEYINPFIESVYDLFKTMLSTQAVRGDVSVVRNDVPPRDIIALIGLSGPAKGMVTIAFPANTALAIANRFLDTDLRVLDDMVSDAIAEVVNIVAGGAKAKFKSDPPIELSLPSVVRGNSFCLDYPSGISWLEVPFESGLGAFVMRVTFKNDKEEK